MENSINKKATNHLRRKRTWIAYSFIAPNFIGFFVFTLIPILFSLVLAFMKWDSFSTPEFAGLDNFRKMANDETFWISLKNTFLYTAAVVPGTLVCSLGLALLLNQKIRGMKLFRTIFFFPYVTSLVAIVIVSIWRGMGYYMILYLAGLQSIQKELYEASSLDGANRWKQFLNVTLPSLRPTTFFVTIMLVINCFKVFDLVQVMTDGGLGRATNVLVYQIYNEAFKKFDFGYASAISLVLFVIVLGVTVVQFSWNKRRT